MCLGTDSSFDHNGNYTFLKHMLCQYELDFDGAFLLNLTAVKTSWHKIGNTEECKNIFL